MKDNARLLWFAIPGAIVGFLAVAFRAGSSPANSTPRSPATRDGIIPQLTARQANTLITLSNMPIPAIIVPLSAYHDDRETAKRLHERHEEIIELVRLGLLEEADEELTAPIREQMRQTGRRYRIYGLTETGYFLFARNENRPAN